MAKKLTSAKAKKILHDKSVHGHPLTEQQRKFFGAIAGGAKPYKAESGGWLDKYEQGGLVLKQQTKDNYGKKPNPNNPDVSLPPGFKGLAYNTKGRNYSPAWGGQFQDGGNLMPAMAGAVQTVPMAQLGDSVKPIPMQLAMGGSLPGAVGFMYARTQSPAPSNGPYAKKTKASAQDGEEVMKGREYVEQWMNSPMYKQMLEKSAQGPELERISKGRIASFNVPTNVSRDINLEGTGTLGQTQHRVRTILNATGPEYEEMMKIMQKTIDNPKDKEAKRRAEEVMQPIITGWNIGLNPKLKPGTIDYESTLAHEYGHTTDNPFISKFPYQMSRKEAINLDTQTYIPKSDIEKMKAYSQGKVNDDLTKYISKPQETRQYLNDIRYLGKSQGVYDPFSEKITPEQYKRIKPTEFNDPAGTLRNIYTDEQIIDMLNSISKKQNVSDRVPTAQNGQEMKFYQEGLDFKPKTISQNGSAITTDINDYRRWQDSATLYNQSKAVQDYYRSKGYRVKPSLSAPPSNYIQIANQEMSDLARRFNETFRNFKDDPGEKNIPFLIDPSGNTYYRGASSNFIERAVTDNAFWGKEPYKKEFLRMYNKLKTVPKGYTGTLDMLNSTFMDTGVPVQYLHPSIRPTVKLYVEGTGPRKGNYDEIFTYDLNAIRPRRQKVEYTPDKPPQHIPPSKKQTSKTIGPFPIIETPRRGKYVPIPREAIDLGYELPTPKPFVAPKAPEQTPTKYTFTYPTGKYNEQKTMYFPSKVALKSFVGGIRDATYQEGKDYASATGTLKNGGWLDKYEAQDGGDIPVDPMGYWNPENVGGPVIIPSNVITMEDVDQPLLGISDTGDVQYMEPGEDYEFDGEYVTEYPVAQKGKRVPITVSDINDPRLRAYRDSLSAYNAAKKAWEARAKSLPGPDLLGGHLPYETVSESIFNKKLTEAEKEKQYSPKTFKDYKYFKNNPYWKVTQPALDMMNRAVRSAKVFPEKNIGVAGVEDLGQNLRYLPFYKKPVQPVEYKKPEPKQEVVKKPEPVVEKKAPLTDYFQGTPVYAPTPYHGSGAGAFVGYRTPQGDTVFVKPEDYERMGVPKYGREFIESKTKKMKNGGVSVNNADAQPLKKLDQSLNFTNYNKPTKGGWLDKYN